MCVDSYKASSLLNPAAQEWSPTPHNAHARIFHPLQYLPHVIFAQHSHPVAAPPPPEAAVHAVAFAAPPPLQKPYYHSFVPYGACIRRQPFYPSAPVTFPANWRFNEAPPPFSGSEKYLEKVERPTMKSPKSPPFAVRRTCFPPRMQGQGARMSFNVDKKPMSHRQVWRPKRAKSESGGAAAPSPPCDSPLKAPAADAPRVEESSSRTTIMIRNIPNQLRRDGMLEFLDEYCIKYSLEYDFLYLPVDFRKEDNLGYAFVNFTSGEAALKLKEILQDYRWVAVKTDRGLFKSKKICEITWAKIQGKEELVKKFQNTSFACNKWEFLPVVLDPPRNGSDPKPAPPVVLGRLQNGAVGRIC